MLKSRAVCQMRSAFSASRNEFGLQCQSSTDRPTVRVPPIRLIAQKLSDAPISIRRGGAADVALPKYGDCWLPMNALKFAVLNRLNTCT